MFLSDLNMLTIECRERVVNDGLRHRMFLDDYRSYDAALNKPYVAFDHWSKMLQSIPENLIIKCSDPANDRDAQSYISITQDTDVQCHFNDTIWFSPSCRSNLSECVPTMVIEKVDMTMQLAFFLRMPLAIIMVSQGANDYQEYIAAARNGRYIFFWLLPDDELYDQQGGLPVQLELPPANSKEQNDGIYSTSPAPELLRTYAWQKLSSVDSRVSTFASNLEFSDSDIEGMMAQSVQMRLEGRNPDAAARDIACGWVRGNRATWAPWIPTVCPAGSWLEVGTCSPCPVGSFCTGGFAQPVLCPVGLFCPANASQPAPCESGWETRQAGAAAADCNFCAAGYVPAAGGCWQLSTLIISLVCFSAIAAAAFHYAKALVPPSEEELRNRRVAQRMVELRSLLRIRRRDGFLLSSERPPIWRKLDRFTVVREAHLRAAALLDLLAEEADVRQVVKCP